MTMEHLKTASENLTYAGIIAAALTGGIAWALTRVNRLKEWQINLMEKKIEDIFEKKILPQVVEKSSCDNIHKLTDSNMHYMRQDLAEMKKSNDAQHAEVKSLLQVLIEGIVSKSLKV